MKSLIGTAAVLGLLRQGAAQLQSGIYTHYPDCVNGPELLTSNLVCDTSASPAARAAAIINAMNITEKLANLLDVANGTARLGLPPYEWWSEALHGLAGSPGVNFTDAGEYSYATSFPMPILFSAAFDDPMVQDIATVISTEARAYSNVARAGLDFFTPNINPFKDPRCTSIFIAVDLYSRANMILKGAVARRHQARTRLAFKDTSEACSLVSRARTTERSIPAGVARRR